MPDLKENGYKRRDTVEGLAQSVLHQTSHHALQWDGHLVESQQRLEIKICSLVLCDWRLWWLWNQVLVRCLAGTDYRMPELISDDLILGSGLCLWSSTFT
ncbi:hypothetical protein M9H77_35108 [Catharanthus roseus]|uniref:Uncharacterized protein n=1 Tax=Catharanthus roseus TaxID=4058 RepID=A0ACB9ZPZ0_CATRO|nr:hypothetical protein M9H77_35108 [Catharanthus roseus]